MAKPGSNSKENMWRKSDAESASRTNALAFMHPSTRPVPKKETKQ